MPDTTPNPDRHVTTNADAARTTTAVSTGPQPADLEITASEPTAPHAAPETVGPGAESAGRGVPRSAGRDEDAVRLFVEQMALTWSNLGFPRMPARVLMSLMCSDDDGLTASDLSQQLSVSPAAISGAVRYLIQIGMVVREPARGSRRDRYRVPDDGWYVAGVVKGGMYKTLAQITDGGIGALGGPDTPAGARIAEMRDFFTFLQDEMANLLDRWEKYRAARSTGA